MVGAAHAGWVESYADGRFGSALTRAALDAIAPMVEERLTMAHHDGYVDGWNERGEDL